MKFPNKVIRYNASVISKFSILLRELENGDLTPLELYRKVERKMDGIVEYTNVLECLFYLGYIEITAGEERLHYAKRNTL